MSRTRWGLRSGCRFQDEIFLSFINYAVISTTLFMCLIIIYSSCLLGVGLVGRQGRTFSCDAASDQRRDYEKELDQLNIHIHYTYMYMELS